MAKKLDNIKAKNPSTRLKVQVMSIVVCLVLVVGISAILLVSNQREEKTISVCRLANSVSSGSIIKNSDLEEYKMKYSEYLSGGTQKLQDGSKRALIVRWDMKDKIVGKRFASSYLYSNSNLLWTMLTSEQEKKHSYLYSMDGELLNIQMSADDFGEIVVPGDKLNIRVNYTTKTYDLPQEEEYMLSDKDNKYSDGIEVVNNERLFNEVTVLDMLNSQGESIFDIYYDFISKSKAAQKKLLSDDAFVKSIKAETILLQATSEEADRFMYIKDKNPKYLITLLPRTGTNAILDSLSDISNLIKQSNSISSSDK